MPEHSQFRHCARWGGGGISAGLSHSQCLAHSKEEVYSPKACERSTSLSQPMNFSRVSKCIEVQLKPLALTAAAEES